MASKTIDTQIKALRKKLDSAAASRRKQILALRAKAADAALQWVMSHESRVNQFKGAVKGTPVAAAVDKLIDLLKAEARPARKAPAKAARKTAKKAVRKAAKKAPRKAVG
ncbi:hypothetical protein AAG565_01305 [Fontimonas sp. SYSU GA230001]|uniref:hypothetical protein n=1 Tax=Fontimonas sp. SYSU GA230001 TaxID=3142450 RepID=UPI0032B3C989